MTRELLIFPAPFRPLVHRRPELAAALRDDSLGDPTKDHLLLLFDFLDLVLADVIRSLYTAEKSQTIDYALLWALFRPGDVVLATRYGETVANRLRQAQYVDHARHGPCLELRCDQLENDGFQFGYADYHYYIRPYADAVPITQLAVYPIRCQAREDEIRDMLVTRGCKYAALATGGHGHHRLYKGAAIDQSKTGPRRTAVYNYVVVDTEAERRFNESRRLPALVLRSLSRVEPTRRVQAKDARDDGWGDDDDNDHDSWEDEPPSFSPPPVPLTDDQVLLASPVVKGYVLERNQWFDLLVDLVTDIGIENVSVNPPPMADDAKELFKLLTTHIGFGFNTSPGAGFVAHFSGPPGTGKTLTAAAVAQKRYVPLLMMRAALLGTTAADIEASLTRVSELAARWRAVLVLDDCDAFLMDRRSSDLDLELRSIKALLSRMFEFYEGILFLFTSPSVDSTNIDPAFDGCIRTSLRYLPFDEAARRLWWHNLFYAFVRKSSSPWSKSDETAIKALAALPLNTLQIESAMTAARQLEASIDESVTYESIKSALRLQGYSVKDI